MSSLAVYEDVTWHTNYLPVFTRNGRVRFRVIIAAVTLKKNRKEFKNYIMPYDYKRFELLSFGT